MCQHSVLPYRTAAYNDSSKSLLREIFEHVHGLFVFLADGVEAVVCTAGASPHTLVSRSLSSGFGAFSCSISLGDPSGLLEIKTRGSRISNEEVHTLP
jgi:hypothetical protein